MREHKPNHRATESLETRHPREACCNLTVMFRTVLYILVVVGALSAFIWSSDHITLEGERTIYTVTCEHGTWDGLRCSGRIAAGDRYRFRSSRSRREVIYWISGSVAPSGKYADCSVTDRDFWSCKANAGEQPSIAHELSDGRPVQRAGAVDMPFHAVAKWKWWALRLGIPGFRKADFSNTIDMHKSKLRPPDAPTR